MAAAGGGSSPPPPFDGWDDLRDRYSTDEVRRWIPEVIEMIISQSTVYRYTRVVGNLDNIQYAVVTGWQITPGGDVFESNFLIDTITDEVLVQAQGALDLHARNANPHDDVDDTECTYIGWRVDLVQYDAIQGATYRAGGGFPITDRPRYGGWIPTRIMRYRREVGDRAPAVHPLINPERSPDDAVVPSDLRRKRGALVLDSSPAGRVPSSSTEVSPETFDKVPRRAKRGRHVLPDTSDESDDDGDTEPSPPSEVPSWNPLHRRKDDDDDPPPKFDAAGIAAAAPVAAGGSSARFYTTAHAAPRWAICPAH